MRGSDSKILSAALLAAIALSGCAAHEGSAKLGDTELSAESGVLTPPKGDPIATAAFWGTRYDRDPSDIPSATAFSAALRKIGQTSEAVSVMLKTERIASDDPDVRLELGRALISDGRAFEGVRHLEDASRLRPGDWSILSAHGVALDQIGEHKAAQAQYNKALTISPNNVAVMNNKALSLALQGDLTDAELILRRATGSSGASAQVRQNLALVLGLKGDFSSAERLARGDLPPKLADNNMAYYRSLLSQPAYWRDLQALDSQDSGGADSEAYIDVPSGAPLQPTSVSGGAPLKLGPRR